MRERGDAPEEVCCLKLGNKGRSSASLGQGIISEHQRMGTRTGGGIWMGGRTEYWDRSRRDWLEVSRECARPLGKAGSGCIRQDAGKNGHIGADAGPDAPNSAGRQSALPAA